MIDSTHHREQAEFGRPSAPAISVRETLGWAVVGMGVLVVMTIVGVLLQTWWTAAWLSRRDLAALAGAISGIYVPLLVTPLAVGSAVALTLAAPLTTLLRAPSGTRPTRILVSLGVFAPVAFVYWFVGGAVATAVSAPMARWMGDVPGEVFEHYRDAFHVPGNTVWSLVESVVLAAAILIVYVVTTLRRPVGERSPALRALVGVVAVTVVLGAVFAANAVHAYHALDLGSG